MNNNRRKNRGGPTSNFSRPSRMRSVTTEGVYNNPHFMHAATSQVGNIVRIKAASGSVWEGVFRTFSSQFEIVLEVAAKVENADSPHNSSLAADTFVDKLIFRPADIISMVARDVDVNYASRDTFQTDAAISARLNGQQNLEEKVLEPWESPIGVNGSETSLELEPGSNGWDANDMFRKNEVTYGVQSTYDHSLSGYTVQLQATDSKDYKEAEAKANEIANEIENQPNYKARTDLENGDEEERFAAVARPRPNQDFKEASANDKYVPPAKRKGGQTTGKVIRSTPPPITTPSPKPAQSPMSYPTHIRESAPAPAPALINIPPPHIHQNPPPHPIPQQQQQQQHPPVMRHTPPTHYNPRQAPPPKQMNGEAKQIPQRPSRNVYPSPQYQEPPAKQEIINNVPRHREETNKDLHKFSQDFKLGEIPEPKVNLPPPQQSISPPQQDPIEKVSNTLKKSKLNPEAKEFVMNLQAKPFTPRSPSTPNASRPHTPQTPSNTYNPTSMNGPPGQPLPISVMPMGYVMTPQQFQPPVPGNRIRKMPMSQIRTDMASQMQVAAATGQPLLAPAPMQPFVYSQGINHQTYQQIHALRMYESPPQLQYMQQNPSNAPSPAQQPQYTTGQPQQPPPQQYQGPPPQGPPPFPVMCITSPQHMMQAASMHHYLQQPPPPHSGIQMLMHQQHQQQQHQHQNP